MPHRGNRGRRVEGSYSRFLAVEGGIPIGLFVISYSKISQQTQEM